MSNFSTNGDAVQSTVKGLFCLYSNGWEKKYYKKNRTVALELKKAQGL